MSDEAYEDDELEYDPEALEVELELPEALDDLSAMSAGLRQTPHVTLTTCAILIDRAIGLGAPLYNRGDHDACARLYMRTSQLILEAAGVMPGELRLTVAEALDDLTDAYQRAQAAGSVADRAWILRHAFDKIVVSHQIRAEHLRWMMELGEAAFARGDYPGSMSAMRTAARLAPDLFAFPDAELVQSSHLALVYYGHALLLCGRWRDARRALAQALTLAPQLGQVDFDLRKLGDHAAAFQASLDELEDMDASGSPELLATTRFLRAYLYAFSGQRTRAHDMLALHIAQQPLDDDAQTLLIALGSRALQG